jgi:hypothetical protein
MSSIAAKTKRKRYNWTGTEKDEKRRAKVAELVDAPDLGSGAERCGGSSPPFRTRGPHRKRCRLSIFDDRRVLWSL